MSQPRACILSVSGEVLTPDERRFLAEAQPWGVILMGRSTKTRLQVRALVNDIQDALGRACLIFIDQEGGRVRRMRPPEWPDFPAAKFYGDLYQTDPALGLEASWLGHRLMAAELTHIGIHADCAPVLDIAHPGAHEIVGDRAFGETPNKVVALAREALNGLTAGGVAGVVKHMPGHGRALADSHESLPVVNADAAAIAIDRAPFKALNTAPMGMTAHVAYTALDGQTPATISPKIIADIIRDEIGFEGVLMSDDLGMKALGGDLGARAGKALAAGCDIALHCAGFTKEPDAILEEMRAIADNSDHLSGASLSRALAAEKVAQTSESFDEEAGWARFRELRDRHGEAMA